MRLRIPAVVVPAATVVAVAAVVALVAAVTGCPPKPQPEDDASRLTPPVSRLQLWTIWSTDPRKSALDEIVRRFEESNPGIEVAVNNVEPDAYKTKIRVAIGAGEPPDLFFVWSGEWLHNFVRGGNVLPITEALDADDGAWRKLIPADALRYYTFDAETYGIPFLRQCTFFFCNTKLFAQHGLQVPKTWDEFISVCRKLKAAGITPVALGNTVKWPAHHYVSCLWQRIVGQDRLDVDYDPLGPGAYSDPGYVRGLQMLADFAKMGFFSDSPNATTRENARALFYTGEAAMFYSGTWILNSLREGGEAPEDFLDSWDWFNFPAVPGGRGDQQALMGGADGYVISSKTQAPDAAIKFLRHLGSVESAQYFVGQCKELAQVKGAVTADNADEHLQKYARQVEGASRICPWTDTLTERSVAEVLLDGCQALLAGSMTPEEILSEMRARQAKVKQELAARGGTTVTEGPSEELAKLAAVREAPEYVAKVVEHSDDWKTVTVWVGPPASEFDAIVYLEWQDNDYTIVKTELLEMGDGE